MNKSATLFSMIALCTIFSFSSASAIKLPPVTASDPDMRTDRLCDEAADPDAAPDKVHIHCRLEYGTFAPPVQPASGDKRELLVVAYNMERGMKLDRQIELLKNNPDFGNPDIILVEEADRGCSRTNYRNVARDLAKALGMNYIFGVEFMELPRKTKRDTDKIDTLCEHGNALLSRYPITGADQLRYRYTHNWYVPPGPERDNIEPRLGGCMAVIADIDVAGAPMRAYVMHFDSNLDMNDARTSAVKELLAHAQSFNGPIIMGGDMNVYGYMGDVQAHTRKEPATAVFLDAGWKDAHSAVKARYRGTLNNSVPFKAIIDVIFLHGPEAVQSGVCPLKICNDLSDHLPIWTRVQFKTEED